MDQKFGIFLANGTEGNWGPSGQITTKGLSMLPKGPFKSEKLAMEAIEEDPGLKDGTGPYYIIPVTRYKKGTGVY